MTTKPISKADLEAAFKAIEGHKLRADRILMCEADFLELSEQKKCKSCGGWFSNKLSYHPIDDCNLHKVFGIMES